MKLCIIGRAKWLLDAADRLSESGDSIELVITAKETAESRATADDYAALARKHGASFFRSLDPAREDILAALSQRSCDLALTMNYPGLIGAAFLKHFPLGVVNCHGSLLPKYRGNACPNWAILNGDAQTGFTLHDVMPNELDSGDILLQRAFALGDDKDIGDVYEWYDAAIPEAFVTLAESFRTGNVKRSPQDSAQASHAYPRRPSDGRLDLRRPAAECLRLIRASTRPFDGAFCFFENEVRVKVWKASLIWHDAPVHAVPGQILRVDDQGRPHIWTGNGAIRYDDYQTDGPVTFSRRGRMT